MTIIDNERIINLANQLAIATPITRDEAIRIIDFINRGGLEKLIRGLDNENDKRRKQMENKGYFVDIYMDGEILDSTLYDCDSEDEAKEMALKSLKFVIRRHNGIREK